MAIAGGKGSTSSDPVLVLRRKASCKTHTATCSTVLKYCLVITAAPLACRFYPDRHLLFNVRFFHKLRDEREMVLWVFLITEFRQLFGKHHFDRSGEYVMWLNE